MSAGWIYLKDDGRDYKIGRTSSPRARKGQYATENPRLKVIDIYRLPSVEDSIAVEKELKAATRRWKTFGIEWRERRPEVREQFSIIKAKYCRPEELTDFDMAVVGKSKCRKAIGNAQKRKAAIEKASEKEAIKTEIHFLELGIRDHERHIKHEEWLIREINELEQYKKDNPVKAFFGIGFDPWKLESFQAQLDYARRSESAACIARDKSEIAALKAKL